MPKLKEGFTGEQSIVLPEMIQRLSDSDIFLQQLHITDIGYYPHAMYHYRERPNGVKQYILIYCVKGSGWYSVLGKRHEIKEQQYFIIPQGEPHVYASNNDDPCTIYWVHFTGTMASFFGDNCYTPTNITTAKTSRIADRNSIFEEIFLTLSDNYGIDNLRYASSLLYGFLASFKYIKQFRNYNTLNARLANNDIVSAAVRFMNENIEKQLTLSQIADYIGYSTSQFSLIFKIKTGHSPLNYFNMLKVQRACKFLETTDLKINQICSKVGIDDSYYFSRLFSKTIGISPKQYRKAKESAGN